MKFLINMILAYIIYPFRKHSFKGRNIWIVGGNAGDLYVDNGRAIYEYLRTKEAVTRHVFLILMHKERAAILVVGLTDMYI